ncbi:MAG: ABC transporter ATP-binding protein [Phycisphaerales bacterium]
MTMPSPEVAKSAKPADPLLEVRDLKVWFPLRASVLGRVKEHAKAVDGVSFEIRRGETLGLVGESGCGKTTVGRAVLRLIEPTEGIIRFEGRDVRAMGPRELRACRPRMQIIFQDPAGSLNPRMTVGRTVAEPLVVHGVCRSWRQARERVVALLEKCGMPADSAERYPHEFSGGQRQRVAVARALALEPAFIVCDEPTSALDVSVQAQVLNLLTDLRDQLGLSYLFISHDMGVVRHIAQRVAVMRGGRIVEQGTCDEVLNTPKDAYTRALLDAVPVPDPKRVRRAARPVPSAA